MWQQIITWLAAHLAMFEALLTANLVSFRAWLPTNLQTLQALNQLVSIVGIPIFILVFILRSRQDRLAREDKIYDDVDQSFVSFNQLVLSHPELNASWFDIQGQKLCYDQTTQQYIMFDLLTNMFERAYLTYRYASGAQRKNQWKGWEEYIELYCSKKDYQDWWFNPRHGIGGKITLTYDAAFEKFLTKKLDTARRARATTSGAQVSPPVASPASAVSNNPDNATH